MTKVSYTNACSKYFKGSLNKSELENKLYETAKIEIASKLFEIVNSTKNKYG